MKINSPKKLTVNELLQNTRHRTQPIPQDKWKLYQEWHNVVFLHWRVSHSFIRKLVPANLEIDSFDGDPWVSLVAFDIKVRPVYLPFFPPISQFYEINFRTYVKYNGKEGIYFLSMEANKKLTSIMARAYSGLPYRFSNIITSRNSRCILSLNEKNKDSLQLEYNTGAPIVNKRELDIWLTERYSLFHETRIEKKPLFEYELHHFEWPLYHIGLKVQKINYSLFRDYILEKPVLAHYAPFQQVVTWGKRKLSGPKQ
jgi:uncharacterized protein